MTGFGKIMATSSWRRVDRGGRTRSGRGAAVGVLDAVNGGHVFNSFPRLAQCGHDGIDKTTTHTRLPSSTLQRQSLLKGDTSATMEFAIATNVKRFRVLTMGNANAGKTTILDKVCHANGREPQIVGKRVLQNVNWFLSFLTSPKGHCDLRPSTEVHLTARMRCDH